MLVGEPALAVGADHQTEAAVGVDVVDAALGVVLGGEDGRVLPERRVADLVDDLAEGVVVLGDVVLRRLRAGDIAGRVVTGSTENALTYAAKNARCTIGTLMAKTGN